MSTESTLTPASPRAKRRQGSPVHVAASGVARVLARLAEHSYDEAWLQCQIHANPSILPIWEIEPSCWPAVPVCMELPLASGFVDNLLVSRDGNLVLVECKLWRNPEARRKVVAQIIDYAKDLMRLDYAGLERQIEQVSGDEALTRQIEQAKQGKTSFLYEIAGSDLTEGEFVDAVACNLRRGRFLLVIAGDGITESVEAITDYLQQHAGIHFTLAMVQLAVFDLGGKEHLIVPSVAMRSVNIVRGIVEIQDGKPTITGPPPSAHAASLSEAQFMEGLDKRVAGTSTRLRELLDRGQDLGLQLATKRTMLVRWALGEAGGPNLLGVWPDGNVETNYVWSLEGPVPRDRILEFLAEWARSIPGSKVSSAPKIPGLRHESRPLNVWDLLDHADAWLQVVRRFRETVLDLQRRAPAD